MASLHFSRTLWLSTVVMVLFVVASTRAEGYEMVQELNGRVVIPVKSPYPSTYILHFTPNFETFTFTATADIVIQFKGLDKTKVTLNSLGLNYTLAELYVDLDHSARIGGDISVLKNESEAAVQFVFGEKVTADKGWLHLEWTGPISNGVDGWYSSQWVDGDKSGYIFATQLEPVSARKVFPCLDEPGAKATYAIKLTVPSHMEAISNGRLNSVVENDDGTKTCNFQTMPAMSSYLVALVVGEFQATKKYIAPDSLPATAFVPFGVNGDPTFSLQVANNSLNYFNWYFDKLYELYKLDLVVIPDFSAGAMENWGLITFRETAMLTNPESPSLLEKQRVAEVVAHEVAHQWFGNLVTMEWWSDLWLNEGFATWAAAKVNDWHQPDWDVWTDFASSYTFSAFELDSLSSTHPVYMSVNRAEEISELFDRISYNKGASLVRMMSEFVGQENFRAAIKNYVDAKTYDSAHTGVLMGFIQQENENEADVGFMMRHWINKPGFPIVTVWDDEGTLNFAQERYLPTGSKLKGEFVSNWEIPVNYLVKMPGQPPVAYELYLDQQFDEATLPENMRNYEWIKVNPSQVGYYRVNYMDAMQDKLSQNYHKLTTLDRLGVANDLFARFKSGHVDSTQFIEALGAFRNEGSRLVWLDIDNNVEYLQAVLDYIPLRLSFRLKEFLYDLYLPMASRLALTDDTLPQGGLRVLTQMYDLSELPILRSIIFGRLASLEVGEVVEAIMVLFKNEFFPAEGKEPIIIPADLRGVVFKTIARHGQSEFIYKLHEIAIDQSLPSIEQIRAIKALGNRGSREEVLETLKWVVENVRPTNIPYVFIGAGESKLAEQLAWKFVQENWAALAARMSGQVWPMKRILEAVLYYECREEALLELAYWLKHTDVVGLDKTIAQVTERIELNIAFLKSIEKKLPATLETHNLKITALREAEFAARAAQAEKIQKEAEEIEDILEEL